MAGPYDYTINIPQPPAQNFIQNLTGIMQLRQMQEQGAIQQQQAAIQQQNAQFAQQMQPLQLEAERARIGQIGQATATSAEALRQGKLTFEQAQQDRVRQMEQQAVAQAQQRELVGKFTSLPPNAPMSEIVPIANQLLLLPGGEKVAKQAMDNFDALQQEFQKASKTALVTATTQLQAGDVEGAKKTYSTFEQAVRNSGGTNPQLAQLADGIKAQKMLLDLPNDQGVNSAKLASVQMLSIVDPKAADTILQSEKVVVPAKEKQVDEEKRALDLEKERLQIQEIKQKLDQAREEKVKVFASTNKFAKELSDTSVANKQTADSASEILRKIDSGEVVIPSTAKGAAWQSIRDNLPFFNNEVSLLRKEYQKLANSEVMKSLPPGSASDADRKFAQEGVMSKNANPEIFRKGVEAMGRLAEYASRYNEAKLAWVSQNAGSAGNALKEFPVFGDSIKKGTAFNAWWNSKGNKLNPDFMPDQEGASSVNAPVGGGGTPDLQSLLNKYR
jgi:hypothetical protein